MKSEMKRVEKIGGGTRQSNIELLRIIAMFGVCTLHYNYGRGLIAVAPYSCNYFILMALEALNVCAVDLFVLISGYFSCTRNSIKIGKLIDLLAELIFINLLRVFTTSLVYKSFSVKHFLMAFIPMNYFLILYITLTLLSPFINIVIKALDIRKFRKLLMLLLALFSIFPFILDTEQYYVGFHYNDLSTIGRQGSNFGYSLVQFVLMYFIGAYLRLNSGIYKKSKDSIYAIVLWLVLYAIGILGTYFGFDLNFSYSYCNPFVILFSVLIFLIFLNTDIKPNKVINFIARAAFSVYLIHGNFLNLLKINELVTKNTTIMLLHLLGSLCIMYMAGIIIYLIWDFISRELHKVPFIDRIRNICISAEKE